MGRININYGREGDNFSHATLWLPIAIFSQISISDIPLACSFDVVFIRHCPHTTIPDIRQAYFCVIIPDLFVIAYHKIASRHYPPAVTTLIMIVFGWTPELIIRYDRVMHSIKNISFIYHLRNLLVMGNGQIFVGMRGRGCQVRRVSPISKLILIPKINN